MSRHYGLRPATARGAGAGPGAAAVEVQAPAVEAVELLAGDHVEERDLVDHVLPADAEDVDVLQGRLEPVAEPVVARPLVGVDPAPDLLADRRRSQLALEDALVDPVPGRDEVEGEVLHPIGRPLHTPEGLGDAGDAAGGLVEERGVLDPGR